MIRRRDVLGVAPALAATTFAGSAFAQAGFPNKPIRIIVGNAAGGTDDVISRHVADKLQKEWGQPVIVENRGGGSTTIAGAHVASSPPDGYTLMCLINTGINQTLLRDKLPYKLSSFVPVAGAGGFPVALAVSAIAKPKITTLQELAAARNLKAPVYEVLGRSGSHHAPVFTVSVAVRGLGEATGDGTTKQDAETAAAEALLAQAQ